MTPDRSLAFSTFVATAGNRDALAACLRRASCARSRVPLLLVGGVATGKTHLLHAVANAVRRPRLVTAEHWRGELVDAVTTGRMNGPHEQGEALDALLLDDVQVLAGMPATQRVLAESIAALARRGCAVVIALGGNLSTLRPLLHAARVRIARMAQPTPREMRAILAARRSDAPSAVVREASRRARDVRCAEGALNVMLASAALT